MNAPLPAGPLTQAIGWSLLHVVWQGALVAAVLAALLPLLAGRSANVRYAVSCLTLALIVMLGVATGVRSYRAAAPHPTPVHAVALAPSTTHAGDLATDRRIEPDRLRAWVRAASNALPGIVMIWLAGVMLLSVRLALEWLRARRLLTRNAVPASRSWQAAARRLSAVLGVRHVVRVLESAAVEVPSVIGLVRPAILLPASTLTGLTAAQLEMILAHELAHIRRHDFLVNLLQAVVETLLFYHPAVWWISRQIRIERENCCDDLAVAACGNRLQYARALLRLEELRAKAPVFAMSAGGGSLFERIRRIALGPAPAHGRAVRPLASVAALLCVLLAIAAPSLSARVRPATALRNEGRSSSARHVAVPATLTAALAPLPVARPASVPAANAAAHSEGEVQASNDAPVIDSASDPSLNVDQDPGKPTLDDLIALRTQGVGGAYVREMRALFPGIQLKEIANSKAVGMTAEYVREIRAAGIAVESARDAQGLVAVGVTPRFVRDMRSVGLEVESAHDAQGLAAVGVTPEYVHEMRASGLAVRSAEEAQGLAGVGVTPEFIRQMRSAGLAVESAQQAQGLAGVGVTPEFIRQMRNAGLAVESAEQAQGLAGVGVTPEFIRQMRSAGLPVETAQEAQGLAAVGVTPRFIADMRAAGVSMKSSSDVQGMAAVGVTPEYVRGLRQAGVDISRANDLQSMRALGITPRFVQRLADAGYKNLTVQELSRLAAGGVTGDFVHEMSQYRSR